MTWMSRRGAFLSAALLAVLVTVPNAAGEEGIIESQGLFDSTGIEGVAIVVVALPGDFLKRVESGYTVGDLAMMPIKIDRVVSGRADLGPGLLYCDATLPLMLSARGDAGGQFLLPVTPSSSSHHFYLAGIGGAMDALLHFLPADKSLEKLAATFAKRRPKTPDEAVVLGLDLLAEKDLSEVAADQVLNLLNRSLPGMTIHDSRGNIENTDSLKKVVTFIHQRMSQGLNVGWGATVLATLDAMPGLSKVLPIDDAALAAPARKWLAELLSRPQDIVHPDAQYAETISPVVALLGRLKDRESKEALIEAVKQVRFTPARRAAVEAIKATFGDEAAAILKPLPVPPPVEKP